MGAAQYSIGGPKGEDVAPTQPGTQNRLQVGPVSVEPAIAQQQSLVRRARNALLPQVVEQQGSSGCTARKASEPLTATNLTNAAPSLVRHVVDQVAVLQRVGSSNAATVI